MFNLLTASADTGVPNAGQILIHSGDVHGMWYRFDNTGFCPQTNPLALDCSAKTHLRFFARLSGTYYQPKPSSEEQKKESKDEWYFSKEDSERSALLQTNVSAILGSSSLQPDWGEERVCRILRELGLEKDGDRMVEEFSGGMKRRLTLACSLITEPRLVFLDEACAGVDLCSAKKIWNKINHRPAGQTVVTTTHSMEEAQAMCSRIAILTKGRLACLGTQQELKSRYASGYELELSLHLSEPCNSTEKAGRVIETVRKEVESACSGTQFRLNAPTPLPLQPNTLANNSKQAVEILHAAQIGQKDIRATFRLNSVRMSKIFKWCEERKEFAGKNNRVQEYALKEPTLEQVFMAMAEQAGI